MMAKKGFEGIKAVAASQTSPRSVCVCVSVAVCLSVSVSMALCMCVCVFVCVSYLAIEQLFGQSGGAASHLPHHLTSKDISSRSPNSSLGQATLFSGLKPSLETRNKNWDTRLLSPI